MGLDMYLTKKTYVGANYEHRKVRGSVAVAIDDRPLKINFSRISYISESIGYWRKANHIHKWFVENCQDGEDDCKEYYVERSDLEKLLEVCRLVRDNHSLAEELLPPEQGFFFGSTELGDWYFEDIDYTIKLIEDILVEDLGNHDIEYVYQSSW